MRFARAFMERTFFIEVAMLEVMGKKKLDFISLAKVSCFCRLLFIALLFYHFGTRKTG